MSRTDEVREWLFDYLLRYPEGTPLPWLRAIGDECPTPGVDAYAVSQALESLRDKRRITYRRGTPSLHRGHQAIRLIAAGKILRTLGCPFDAP